MNDELLGIAARIQHQNELHDARHLLAIDTRHHSWLRRFLAGRRSSARLRRVPAKPVAGASSTAAASTSSTGPIGH